MAKQTPTPDGLLKIIEQVKECYSEPQQQAQKGRPRKYTGLSFLLLAVVAVVLRTFKDRELYRLLAADSKLLQALGFDQVPHRRTIERRLQALIPEAEEQIAELGKKIVDKLPQSEQQPQITSIDGRMYKAQGPRWHKKDREQGLVPIELRNVDTQSTWSKSGYRGWVQGYRLVLQCLLWPEPIVLFAAWRPNDEGEATILQQALETEHFPVTDVLLGDQSFGGAELVQLYKQAGGWLLTPQQLPQRYRTWKHELFAYRKQTIELLFQRIIQVCDLKECPVKGLQRNGAFILANVWIYQVIFWHNLKQGKALSKIKEAIDLARWRIAS